MSREGVQRDLLPLVEGTTVATKYGPIKTDHILFIASGAFHVAKPSDLLPELQGRLPIRVELRALEKDDFVRILTETEASLIKQYIALMETEGVTLDFTDDAIDSLAGIAVDLNASVENIGARRLQTVMERVLDEISFNAPDQPGTRRSPSTPTMSRSMSATSPRTQICRDSSFKRTSRTSQRLDVIARLVCQAVRRRLAAGRYLVCAADHPCRMRDICGIYQCNVAACA